MVLHPIGSSGARGGSPVPAWQAVERTQKQSGREWWLVAQPDHAALAGDLAARLDFLGIPSLSTEIIRAIAVHDAGWRQFDAPAVRSLSGTDDAALRNGKPISFLEMSPANFLSAWTESIEEAERVGPVGGIIVNEHLRRLAQVRLEAHMDNADDTRRFDKFISEEWGRQKRLFRRTDVSRDEACRLTDVLQFCDLVSLYLCCGVEEPVEFPQRFDGVTVTCRREGDLFSFTPAVFSTGASLGVSARRYPSSQFGMLGFVIT